MLNIYIGPNGYGKSYSVKEKIKELEDSGVPKRDIILLNSEIVFADEMKDSVNSSFVLDYLVEELLENSTITSARDVYEAEVDSSIKANIGIYNNIMDDVLNLNNKIRTKDVIGVTQAKEHKKLVKINSDDLKSLMGSGQKLQFLLRLIEISTKQYIFLDEPENHTHPSLLHVTAGLINKISENKEVYVVTHSSDLLNMLSVDFSRLFIFNDPDFGPAKHIDFNSCVQVPTTIHLANINSKSRSYFDSTKIVDNILQIHKKEFFEAIFSKRVYIVEGVNDEMFLKKLLFHFNKQYDQYSIFLAYGKPHFIPFINIFKSLSIEVIPLFDCDISTDANNVAINNEIKKCPIYLESKEFLEKEIGYTGNKQNIIELLEYLDSYTGYAKYEYLIK